MMIFCFFKGVLGGEVIGATISVGVAKVAESIRSREIGVMPKEEVVVRIVVEVDVVEVVLKKDCGGKMVKFTRNKVSL